MANSSKLPAWPQMMTPPFTSLGEAFSAGTPGASVLTQSLSSGMELMKNMWGQMPSGVPGFVVPTIDLEDLDKRIADLRAVEGWLELNASMLKTTIQGLEVQRHTVAALKALQEQGGVFSNMMGGGIKPEPEQASTLAHANWPMPIAAAMPGSPPAAVALAPGAALGVAAPQPKSRPERTSAAKKKAPASAPDQPEVVAPALAAAAVESANMWMNFLKHQFSQIAGASLAASSAKPEAARPAPPKATAAAPKKRAKKRAAARRQLASKR